METTNATTAPQSPVFDGTISTTSVKADPALGKKLQCAIAKAFRKEHPSVDTVAIKLISSIEGVPATSERNLYNSFNYVEFRATGVTRSGEQVEFNGAISADSETVLAD